MDIKKVFILILTLLYLTINVNSYNVTYTDLIIDPLNWCPNLDAKIKVYNITEYNNRSMIKDNLCGVNETPTNDRCNVFADISNAKVKIFDGPMNGLSILKDTVTDSNGEFKVTFPNSGGYLIQITPTGRYNEYEELFVVDPCKFASTTIKNSNSNTTTKTIVKEKVKTYNLTLNDVATKTFIKINNITINSSNQIVVSEINNLKLRNLPELNYNIYKTIEVKTLTDANFSKLTIDTQIKKTDSSLNIFYYNKNSKSWEKVTNYNDFTNKILIENANLGIYSIAGNEIKVDVPIVKKEIIKTNDTTIKNSTNTSQNSLLNNNQNDNSSNTTLNIIIITLVIIIICLAIAMVHHFRTFKKNDKSESNIQELKSYNDIFLKAKEYIQAHKNNYSKDQLYRALQNANVPNDIIDKVFSQEY